METVNLSELSNIELDLLMTRESKILKRFDKLWSKVDDLCEEEMGLSHKDTLDLYDYCVRFMNAIKEEREQRRL